MRPGGTLLYTVVHFPWAVFSFSVALSFWACGWTLLTYPLWFWVFPVYAGQDGLQLFGDDAHSVYLDNPFEITVTAAGRAADHLATPWIVRALTSVDRADGAAGCSAPSRLATRVVELESDRGVVVDTAAADLRRIERDLHDGAQARLVALAMDLGLAKEKLTEDPRAAARMVDEAHGEVKTALQELRDLARGIHPAVLTDRGLDAALSSVASRCTVPVQVEVDLPARPAPAIEGIAYFTVSRAAAERQQALPGDRRATVDVWRVEDRLMLQVVDDGVGGADAPRGPGLAGLAERLDAVDGILVVDSPAGGPDDGHGGAALARRSGLAEPPRTGRAVWPGPPGSRPRGCRPQHPVSGCASSRAQTPPVRPRLSQDSAFTGTQCWDAG